VGECWGRRPRGRGTSGRSSAAVSSEGNPVLVCLGPLTRAEENNYARHAAKQGSQVLVSADASPQGNPLCRDAASWHGCPGSTQIAC